MKYDFDKIVPRKGTNSYKWDSIPQDRDILPMWVADMDFPTSPEIIEALQKRVNHGIFGYVRVPDEYYLSTINWFERRHNFSFQRDWMIYTSGVVPAISAIIKALTKSGDGVLVQTPVYNCFFSSIKNNGCNVIANPLKYENNTYTIDFDDLEKKASSDNTKLMLLCNPHNPTGRVWTKEEIMEIGKICFRNNVLVISDEIHCELVFSPYKYTPFASIGDEYMSKSITCISPSKAFNLGGLQISNIIAKDEDLRAKIDRAININEVCDVNPFGIDATIAAYNHGEEWLRQLIEYIEGNYNYMLGFFAEFLPDMPVVKLEGTYLVWVDCRSLNMSSQDMKTQLTNKVGLYLNDGTMYGDEGEGFMRWNIACPRPMIKDALERFYRFVRLSN